MPNGARIATWRGAVGPLGELLEDVAHERHALVMGVVNVTPDSFSDGGQYDRPEAARQQVDRLLAQGADILDIGAESTRPGAAPIPADEQIRRAEPAIAHAVSAGALVSIDTTLPNVADRALAMGARIVNDVSCLAEPGLARVAAAHDADLVIMHSRGSMTKMADFSKYPADGYGELVDEICAEWGAARARALEEGIKGDRIWFDPGIGFHKSADQSFELMRRLEEFARLRAPMLVGPSRKSFLGSLDGSGPDARLGGTIAACLRAVAAGARIVRVHDVHEVRQALTTWAASTTASNSLAAAPTVRGDARQGGPHA